MKFKQYYVLIRLIYVIQNNKYLLVFINIISVNMIMFIFLYK